MAVIHILLWTRKLLQFRPFCGKADWANYHTSSWTNTQFRIFINSSYENTISAAIGTTQSGSEISFGREADPDFLLVFTTLFLKFLRLSLTSKFLAFF